MAEQGTGAPLEHSPGKTPSTTALVLGMVPVAALAALVIIFNLFVSDDTGRTIFDPPLLLPLLNTIFIFLTSLAVAYVSLRSYLIGGSLTVLLLGSAVLALGMGSLMGGWLLHRFGPNATVTIHNTSALLAALLHGAAMITDARGTPPLEDPVGRGRNLLYGYLGVFFFVTFLTLAVENGATPTFFSDRGNTPLRQWVVTTSLFLFVVTSIYFFSRFVKRRAIFLYWYSLALAGIAVNLLGILFQPAVGSPVGWVGRSAQYVAGLYFLVGVIFTAREARGHGLPMNQGMAEVFRKSGENIASILALIADCHYELDRNWKFTRINDHALAYFRKEEGEVLGRSYREVLPQSADSLFEKNYRKVLSDGMAVSFDAPSNLTPGNWVEAHAYPTDEGLSVFFRDVTARKQAEEALRTSEERSRSFFGLPLVGSVITSPDGRWLVVNDRFCEIVGYSRDELYHLTWYDLTPPEELDQELGQYNRILAGEQTGGEVDKHYIHKNGTIVDVHVSALLIRRPDGSPDYFVAMVQDITEHKRAEAALRDKSERLTILSEVASRLLASKEPQAVVEELCLKVMDYLKCDAFFNFLVDEEAGRLRLNACAGIPPETAAEIRWLDFGVAVCGTVAIEARRIVAEHIPTTPDPKTDLIKSFGITAYACHPLLSQGKVIGTLSFGTKSRLVFSGDDLAMMKAVADQVAIAMERKRAVQALGKARDELERRVEERTTELSRARDRLIEQSRIMEGFVDSNITPLVFLDRDFNFVRVNEAYARSCQREVGEFEGRNHFELYPNEENKAIFRRVVETKVPYQATAKPFAFPDHPEWGFTYWDWTLTPLLDHSGEVEYLVFSLKDVTDRIASEQAIRRAGAYNRSLIEASLDPLVTIDPDGRISDVNSATEQITGCSRNELIGTDFSDYFTEPESAKTGYLRAFSEGMVRDYPLQIRHRDGHTTHVLYNASVYYDDTGEIIGIFAAARDVSDLRRAEEQLRQVQKMEAIGTLAGGIAHDFNNVLASILGFTEMAIEDVPDRPQVEKSLQYVLKSAMRARELVKQILAFSRKTEHVRSPLSLSPVIKETIQLLRASIPTTIDITFRMSATSDVIAAAPVEVQQILMNLATNAALAMGEKQGAIEISLQDAGFQADSSALDPDMPAGDYVQISVSDTGEGMAPEVMKRIFEPFFTTREVGKGSGMGLAVVYGIVKSLHGTISVESVPGKGSIFRVSLPKAKMEAEKEIIQIVAPRGGKERILFVDDEDILAELNRERLKGLGYEVTESTSSVEALHIFETDPNGFDLVITDYTMPHLTGIELAGEILKLRKDIPIILCTGYSDAVSPDQAKQAGISEFLMKPLSKAEMAEAVRRALGERGSI